MEKKKVNHAKVCRGLYEKIGSTAVYDYARKNKLTDYRLCDGCEASTPTYENSCLVCGLRSSVEIVNNGHVKIHNAQNEKLIEFTSKPVKDSGYSGIELFVNGKLAVILEYDLMKDAIRIHTYDDKDENPVSKTFKKFKNAKS